MPFPCGETWYASSYPDHTPSPDAIDWNLIGNDQGRSVQAGVAGTATIQPEQPSSNGKWVIVEAGGGWTYRYAHLSSISITSGQTVTPDTEIGKVGNTGYSEGSHLHYEQRLNNVVQPATFNGAAISYSPNFPGYPYSSANCSVSPPVPGEWQWHLRNTNSAGPAFTSFGYGLTTDARVAGDWDGNATTTPGIVRNVNGELQWHLRNDNSAGSAFTSFGYGNANTDTPIVGDWDGNGTFTPGIIRAVNGEWQWHLRNDNSAGSAFTSFGYGNASTDIAVVGDWDASGSSTPGIVRNVGGEWQWHLRNANSAGPASILFGYGNASIDTLIVGDWDGNGTSTPGIVRTVNGERQWHLRNDNSVGSAFTIFGYGNASSDLPIVGDWDGDGTSTPGIIRPN